MISGSHPWAIRLYTSQSKAGFNALFNAGEIAGFATRIFCNVYWRQLFTLAFMAGKKGGSYKNIRIFIDFYIADCLRSSSSSHLDDFPDNQV
jgi:hypothetical protein